MMIKLNNFFESKFGIRFVKTRPISNKKNTLPLSIIRPLATYSPWLEDKEFDLLYKKIKKHTLIDIYRLYEIFTLASQCSSLDGDYLEVGVWKGGSSAVIEFARSKFSSKNIFYIADTFTGVVKASKKDPSYRGGEHSDTSKKIVTDLFKTLNLKEPAILEGIFPDSFPLLSINKLTFLHIDVDTYYSVKGIMEWAMPKLVKNAVVIFDDYGFQGTQGVTKYVNELIDNSNEFLSIYNLNGHVILIKTR